MSLVWLCWRAMGEKEGNGGSSRVVLAFHCTSHIGLFANSRCRRVHYGHHLGCTLALLSASVLTTANSHSVSRRLFLFFFFAITAAKFSLPMDTIRITNIHTNWHLYSTSWSQRSLYIVSTFAPLPIMPFPLRDTMYSLSLLPHCRHTHFASNEI